MNELFSQGGSGSAGVKTNKQAIARHFGVKQSDVVYFTAGGSLDGYKVIYDKATQRSYSLPVFASGTTMTSLSADGLLVHSAGNINLATLAISREEFVSVPGSFTMGGTLVAGNDALTFTDGKYRWQGTFPKVVPPGSSPTSSGGISPNAWVLVSPTSLIKGNGSSVGVGPQGTLKDTQFFITMEQFDAVGDGVTEDNIAFTNALVALEAGPYKTLVLTKLYKLTQNFEIPAGVTIMGSHSEAGFVIELPTPAGLKAALLVKGGGVTFSNMFIGLKSSGGKIGENVLNVIQFDPTSYAGCVERVRIMGRYDGAAMALSIGVHCFGSGHKVDKCEMHSCALGVVTEDANDCTVSNNYIDCRYAQDGPKPWTPTSLYWDCIIMSGGKNCKFINNTLMNAGQSAIYVGGNGFYSQGVTIVGNYIENAWNRGIDCGVAGALSATNNIVDVVVTDNILVNTRNNNLWFAGITNGVLSNNTTRFDSNYDVIFAGYTETHVSIGLGNGDVDAVLNGCIIEGNTVVDPTGAAGIAITAGENNYIGNNNLLKAGDIFIADTVLAKNLFRQQLVKTTAPSVICGTGSVTLNADASYSRITWDGKIAHVDILIQLSAISTPTGILVIQGLPGFTGKLIAQSNLQVSYWNNTALSTVPLCMASEGTPGQIDVYRQDGGRVVYDVAGLLMANTTLHIQGTITVW